jgi:hypothetical protein
MLSKNVSREERNTIEAIHAKRMLIARLGGSAFAAEIVRSVEVEERVVRGIAPGPLRLSLIEIAKWCVGGRRFRIG